MNIKTMLYLLVNLTAFAIHPISSLPFISPFPLPLFFCFLWSYQEKFVTLYPTKPAPGGWAGQRHRWNEALAVVGRVSERRLRTLPFCAIKLRNFESCHRGNATVSVCVGDLYPHGSYI